MWHLTDPDLSLNHAEHHRAHDFVPLSVLLHMSYYYDMYDSLLLLVNSLCAGNPIQCN
jgi:hypothetical protein